MTALMDAQISNPQPQLKSREALNRLPETITSSLAIVRQDAAAAEVFAALEALYHATHTSPGQKFRHTDENFASTP